MPDTGQADEVRAQLDADLEAEEDTAHNHALLTTVLGGSKGTRLENLGGRTLQIRAVSKMKGSREEREFGREGTVGISCSIRYAR